MPSMFKSVVLAISLGIISLSMVNAGQEIFIAEDPAIGKIYLLNVKGKEINQECLKEKIKNIAYYIDNKQIIPYKVEIWPDHPLVQGMLKDKAIRVERSGLARNILIPFESKVRKLILYKDKDDRSYAMYSIASDKLDINIKECIK